ncbi:dTDP-4-dehydrorhamnose reductase [Tamilnaduibacter salinus]|uniref:dTDP-4-dehydrorhamnose reductase n=1 Tax=Tamilnaduibacter salinus TaxID=1484056 RepID=A0A2U1D0Q7_9GAMM|nr:sugar nucleotide-binding protein [Tamilnaduibacter salinus]PVY78888.1 dTDP-4-dehydrorhamnose reductase [Tamilnaduibacter salinus]
MNLLVVHDYSPLGRLLLERLRGTPLQVRPLLVSQPDAVDLEALEDWIPDDTDLIVNALWHTDPEAAEQDPERIRQEVFSIPLGLAEHARTHDMALLQLSTSYVFDGRKQSAYITSNPGQPFSQLGNWQWECEQALRTLLPRHLILRTGWSLTRFLRMIRETGSDKLAFSSRHRGQPLPVHDLARVLRALVMQIDCGAEVWGTYQYAGQEEVSQHELALTISRTMPELNHLSIVDKVPDWARLEPENATLGCTKIRNTFGIKQRSWQDAIQEEDALLQKEGRARSAVETDSSE